MKQRFVAATTAFWVVCSFGAPVQAAEDPSDWLVKMTDGARTATYAGVVVYRSGDMLEPMRVLHRHQQGRMRERLVSLSGEPREIHRTDSEVTCILPRERKVTVDRRAGSTEASGLFPSLPREKVESLKQYYEFKDLGTGRVAGRLCRGIRVQPRDAFRYGYEFWVDEAKHVPLKLSVVQGGDQLLEQLMFTEVHFPDAIPDKAFEPELEARDFQRVTHSFMEGESKNPLAWAIDRLPPGFKVAVRDQRQLPGQQGTVEHLLLSDGLSAVSIYSAVARAPGRGFKGMSNVGAVYAYGRVVGTQHVTVVGEVPPATVQMIGDGLKPAEPGASGIPVK